MPIHCTEPPTKELVTKWLIQTLQALRYLHDELHVQHRDIKPKSILITTAGLDVKLTDILLETFAYSSAQDHHIFTSYYSSMEKISNIEYDGRDDVWGVGCVWTELITRVALRDRSGYISQRKHAELRQAVVNECIAYDSDLGAFIGKMLTLDQTDRPTASQCLEQLSSVLCIQCERGCDAIADAALPDVHTPQVAEHQLFLDHELNKKQFKLLQQIQSPPTTFELLYTHDPPRENFDDMRSVIGQGVFSTTYRKKNAADQVTVYAIKVLREIDAQRNKQNFEQIYSEALALQEVKHPNIVRHFVVFRTYNNEIINIVMELVDGQPLVTYINCTEPPRKDLITKWLIQTLRALQHLHEEIHIQHRDIKPQSILITTAGSDVKLVSIVLKTPATSRAQSSKLASSYYSSLEKADNLAYDGRDDVWGVACVWSELITRVALRDRSNYLALPQNIELRQVVVSECITYDSDLGALIGMMLSLHQADRPTASQCLEHLTLYQSYQPPQHESADTPPHPAVSLPYTRVNKDDKDIGIKGDNKASPVASPKPIIRITPENYHTYGLSSFIGRYGPVPTTTTTTTTTSPTTTSTTTAGTASAITTTPAAGAAATERQFYLFDGPLGTNLIVLEWITGIKATYIFRYGSWNQSTREQSINRLVNFGFQTSRYIDWEVVSDNNVTLNDIRDMINDRNPNTDTSNYTITTAASTNTAPFTHTTNTINAATPPLTTTTPTATTTNTTTTSNNNNNYNNFINTTTNAMNTGYFIFGYKATIGHFLGYVKRIHYITEAKHRNSVCDLCVVKRNMLCKIET